MKESGKYKFEHYFNINISIKMLTKLKTSLQTLNSKKSESKRRIQKFPQLSPPQQNMDKSLLLTKDTFPEWLKNRKDFQAFLQNDGL